MGGSDSKLDEAASQKQDQAQQMTDDMKSQTEDLQSKGQDMADNVQQTLEQNTRLYQAQTISTGLGWRVASSLSVVLGAALGVGGVAMAMKRSTKRNADLAREFVSDSAVLE